jgi:hypothetical protein
MSELTGMTGWERLHAKNLVDDFKSAVAAMDEERLVQIYIEIEVPEDSARKLAKAEIARNHANV